MRSDDDELREGPEGDEPLEEGQGGAQGPDGFGEFLTSETENLQPQLVEEKEVEVAGVFEHHDEELPGNMAPAFVLLRDKQSRQVMIWVGRFEAYAISVALGGMTFDRPMTHDLLKNVFDRLGGKVEKILIDDLWQDTYYAKITVSRDGEVLYIDSRPSDAIALALRSRAPIFMAETVLEQAAVTEEDPES